MSKGLKVTLMMVAIALIGYQAMAIAPTIGEIKDVVIGNENSITYPNTFVYGDAIDLTDVANDPDDGPDPIVWSYAEEDGMYQINGKASAADPLAPDAATEAISTSVATGEVDADSDPMTITFRNKMATPLTGAATKTYTVAGPQDDKILTLFASDGATFTMKNIVVWTDKGGNDRLSPEAPPGPTKEDVKSLSFISTVPTGWAFGSQYDPVTSSTAGGACMTVAAGGTNVGIWYSSYGELTVDDNQVYRLRVNVDSNQATNALNPLWDFLLDNYDPAGQGSNIYGGDYIFLDNLGGANAPNATLGRTNFEVWFTPLPVQMATWRSTAFTTTNSPKTDLRLQFRVLDVAGVAGGELDTGRLCMKSLDIDKFDMDELTADGAAVYNVTTMAISTATEANKDKWSMADAIAGSTSMVVDNGALKVNPTSSSAWTDVAYVKLTPGDATVDMGTGAGNADNWPITWLDNTLYKVSVGISADGATGENNPPDSLRVGMDSPTTELLAVSNITPQLNLAGSPKQTVGTYTMFFYSHSATRSVVQNMKGLRPLVDVLCHSSLNAGGTINAGGFKIHSVKVEKITPAVD